MWVIAESCEAVLDRVAQPVLVIGPGAEIRFANPAAVAVLGYDDASEMQDRPSHTTLQPTRVDGSVFPQDESLMLSPLATNERVRVEQDWLARRDGTMFAVWFSASPIELPDGRGAVCAFKDASPERAGDERATRRRIIEAGDAARRRLARDVHDGAQQQLVTAVMNLQLAQGKLDSDAAAAGFEYMSAGLTQAEAGLASLRDLVAGIHPPILVHLGLAAAIDGLAARLPLPVHIDVTEERFDRGVETSLYFFVSEALTNVIKHAEASNASVLIVAHDFVLTSEVSDDGVGGAAVTPSGSGLRGLADRIDALGGEFTVTSHPAQGTTLRAYVPI